MRRRLASFGTTVAGAAAGFALAAMVSAGIGGPTPTTQAASTLPVTPEIAVPVIAPAPQTGVEYGGDGCGI